LKSDQIEKSGQNAKIWPELLVLARFLFSAMQSIGIYEAKSRFSAWSKWSSKAKKFASRAMAKRSRAHAAHAPQARDHR
jgi:cytochrome b